jgi:hypothetical protein
MSVGNKPTVSKDALQKDISDRLGQAGENPQSVACKDDLVGETGQITRCEVVLSATNSFEPIVKVTGVDGKAVNYEMTPAVSKEQLEKSVSGLVENASGLPVKSVSCESGLEGKVGEVAHCDVDAGGVTLRRTVEVNDVNGLMMKFDLIPLLTATEVEGSLLDQLQQQLGQRPDTANCSDNLEGKTGTTIDCVVTAGSERQMFALTVTTVQGNKINYRYQPKS